VPSVTKVFRKEHNLLVYLEAYQPSAQKTEGMLAMLTFYRGKAKAFESAPLVITEGLNDKSKSVPIRFSPAGAVHPGRYTCQVSLVDPAAEKVRGVAVAGRDRSVKKGGWERPAGRCRSGWE
jgi:hypothetical protein